MDVAWHGGSGRAGAIGSWLALVLAMLTGVGLAGCDRSPPSALVNAAIKEYAMGVDRGVFDADEKTVTVVGVKVESWKQSETDKELRKMAEKLGAADKMNRPVLYEAKWTAELRFSSDVGQVVGVYEGRPVFQTVAKAGTTLPLSGRAEASKLSSGWDVDAGPSDQLGDLQRQLMGDPSKPMGVYQPLFDRAGIRPMQRSLFDRNPYKPLVALSALSKPIVMGSEEEKQLSRMIQEREAAAMAERERLQAERAERVQREAREARERAEAEALVRRQAAEAEAKRRQREALVQRIAPLIEPLRSASGCVLGHAGTGPAAGIVLLSATVDDETFAVTGRGIDMRTLPVAEITFEGGVTERSGYAIRLSNDQRPYVLRDTQGGAVRTDRGVTLLPMIPADRELVEAVAGHARRLQGVAGVSLTAEILDQPAALAAESSMATVPMTGTALVNGATAGDWAAMFAGDLTKNTAYRLRSDQIALRLHAPVSGSALYVRGASAPAGAVSIIVNGVHRINVPAIARLGAARVALPAGLEIIDLRVDPLEAGQLRGIVLVK